MTPILEAEMKSKILLSPLLTEKLTHMRERALHKRFAFKVPLYANKIMIRQAVEKAFGCKVAAVNTMICGGKVKRRGKLVGRTAYWKKAIITLKPGEHIALFEHE